jgi:hypothetical protein
VETSLTLPGFLCQRSFPPARRQRHPVFTSEKERIDENGKIPVHGRRHSGALRSRLGKSIGSIGVSGTTSQQDAQIGQAGIDALK